MNISTIYYHPPLHDALLAVPTESLNFYVHDYDFWLGEDGWDDEAGDILEDGVVGLPRFFYYNTCFNIWKKTLLEI